MYDALGNSKDVFLVLTRWSLELVNGALYVILVDLVMTLCCAHDSQTLQVPMAMLLWSKHVICCWPRSIALLGPSAETDRSGPDDGYELLTLEGYGLHGWTSVQGNMSKAKNANQMHQISSRQYHLISYHEMPYESIQFRAANYPWESYNFTLSKTMDWSGNNVERLNRTCSDSQLCMPFFSRVFCAFWPRSSTPFCNFTCLYLPVASSRLKPKRSKSLAKICSIIDLVVSSRSSTENRGISDSFCRGRFWMSMPWRTPNSAKSLLRLLKRRTFSL